jgi:ferrous iron transport protein A
MKDDREGPLTRAKSQNSARSPEGGNRLTPLDEIEENKKAKVIDIQGGWGEKRRLNQMGIHPGDMVTVVRYGALGGPMVIEVHGFQLALGRGVASQVFVEEVAE